MPGSLDGVHPAYHPGIFGNPAVARSYGFVTSRDGSWQRPTRLALGHSPVVDQPRAPGRAEPPARAPGHEPSTERRCVSRMRASWNRVAFGSTPADPRVYDAVGSCAAKVNCNVAAGSM
jgi:hypothetical protein